MIKLVPMTGADDRCGSCGGTEWLGALITRRGDGDDIVGLEMTGAIVLCPECRIKAEAVLRGARKHGPPVRNWTRGGPDG